MLMMNWAADQRWGERLRDDFEGISCFGVRCSADGRKREDKDKNGQLVKEGSDVRKRWEE